MSSIGQKVLLKIARSEDPLAFAKCKLSSDLFVGQELEVWEFFQSHLEEYAVIPSEETLLSKGFPDLPTPEPLQYYVDLLVERYTHKKLGGMAHEVKTSLNAKELSKAHGLIKETVSALTMLEVQNNLMNLQADVETMYHGHWSQTNSGKHQGIKLGWPYVDDQTGGLISGDIVSIVGRPGMGKSWLMLYSALNMWRKQKKNVLFVSMEMPSGAIMCRMVAMYALLDASQVKEAKLDAHEQEMLEAALTRMQAEKGNFWVLDANLSGTVLDIFSMVSHLKPDVLLIDGTYLLRSDNPRLGRYERVADNVELLKRMAHQAGIPCFCSWQFNRDAAKKGLKTEAVGLEDIGYSDAIGQISSVVLGLFKDNEDDVESLYQRKVTVMKGRDGQTGDFHINWRFKTHEIGFSQVTDEVLALETDLESI